MDAIFKRRQKEVTLVFSGTWDTRRGGQFESAIVMHFLEEACSRLPALRSGGKKKHGILSKAETAK